MHLVKNHSFFLVLWIVLHFENVVVTCHQLFDEGKEYKYSYFGLHTTGTEEPISYASSYMLIGQLRVQGNKENTLIAKVIMKMCLHYIFLCIFTL